MFQFYDMIFKMSYKIRSSEKVKSKSASPKKPIKEISINSSTIEVDEFLKERYEYGIWHFIYSLYWVAALYKLYDLRGEIALLKDKVHKIRSAKTRLIENIDQFLIDTDIWKGIKKGYPDLNIRRTRDKIEKFIASNFHLDRFFKIVDDRIEKINRRIKFFEIYSRIPAKKLRITPRNLIILVWSHVTQEGKKEDNIEFKNISVLLNWFSLNKNWAGMFKSTKLVSQKTPELTYNKYIKFAKDNEYNSLSSCLFIDCFPDIAEPLIGMFPNPFDLVKHELEGKKIMAKDEFEKTIIKPVF